MVDTPDQITVEQEHKNYPLVHFALNEELDAIKLNNFIERGSSKSGANFHDVVTRLHPKLVGYDELPADLRLEKIKEYVKEYYATRREDIEESAKVISKEWEEYAPQFFDNVSKIFGDGNWPDGQYIGYLTICPPYPRFLETKTFHVPYESAEKAIRVTAHEMLHFVFYDYVRRRYLPEMSNTVGSDMEDQLKDKFTIPLWELSELFNLTVLSKDEWGKGMGKQTSSAYTHLASYAQEFEKLWENAGHNIDELFTLLEVK